MLVLAVALGAGTVAADSPAQLDADDAIAQVDDDLVNDTADAIAQVDDDLVNDTADAVADRGEPEPEANEEDDRGEALLYQFENGGEVVSIDFEAGTAYITLRATDGPTRFWIAESVEESGGFSFQNFRVLPGGTRTLEIPASGNAVTITSGNDGYYHEGAGRVTIVTGTPTGELLQLSSISGLSGAIIALGIVIGQLKRKESNTYEELFSDTKHDIESDPIEGAWEWMIRATKGVKESKLKLSVFGLLGVYLVAVILGVSPGPGDLWLALRDGQRLLVAGTICATVLAILPVYMLVKRIWNPNREFVLDLDSRDVYKAAGGDKSGTVRVFAGPPSRISDMEVDGALTTVSTPGGRCHLVRGFEPEQNTAEANPPELAEDRAVSIEVQKIDHNRKILTDLASIGRDLIGAMSSFRVTADAAAMKDIDDGIRNTVSAGTDSMEDVLSDAVAGTRYEGTYQPDHDTDDLVNDTADSSKDSTDQDDTASTTDQQPADTDGGSDK